MNITRIQTGYLGTCTYIVPARAGSGGAFFVTDPGGGPEDARHIIEILTQLAQAQGCKEPAVAGFVMTHGHFDHVGALPFLHARFPEASIAIHELDAPYLGPAATALHTEDFEALNLAGYVRRILDGNPLPEATQLLHDGDELPFAPEWKVLHTPGHSPGSVCLYCQQAAPAGSDGPEHMLLSGDTLFDGGFGRTDLRGGSYCQLQESLARLDQLPAGTLVMPGHGGSYRIG